MNRTREIVTAGLFIALGYVLPMIFHVFSMGGPAFLPMHLPILLAGLVLSPQSALLVGVITPILSSLLTGMPTLYPMLPIMIFELATYGFIIAICYRKYELGYYKSLFIAIFAGRIVAGLVVTFLALGFGLPMSPTPYILGAIVTGLPGIVIQLLAVPALAKLLDVIGFQTYSV